MSLSLSLSRDIYIYIYMCTCIEREGDILLSCQDRYAVRRHREEDRDGLLLCYVL